MYREKTENTIYAKNIEVMINAIYPHIRNKNLQLFYNLKVFSGMTPSILYQAENMNTIGFKTLFKDKYKFSIFLQNSRIYFNQNIEPVTNNH